jgi:hypothetical protein
LKAERYTVANPVEPRNCHAQKVQLDSFSLSYFITCGDPPSKPGRAAVIALVIFLFLWLNYSLYRNYAMYKLTWISHDKFLQNVYGEGFAAQQISNYLKAHTNPDDFIYLWSIHVNVYYYADRKPPIDILWPTYIGATGSPSRIFNARTKYIVLDVLKNGLNPQWLLDGLAANYELETIVDGSEIYRRRIP